MNLQKDKRGFFFVPIMVIGAILLLALVLLIIFAPRIAEVTTPIFTFLERWWWAVGLTLAGIFYQQQVRAVLNFILGKIGIRV